MMIRNLITDRGLKQAWLAEQIGFSPARFSAVVSGKRTLPANKVMVLATAMRVSPTSLLKALSDQDKVAE